MTEQEVLTKEQELIKLEQELKDKQREDKIKERRRRKQRSFLIWTLVVFVVIFLTLFLSSRIGEFRSIADMLRYIASQPITFD